MRPSLAPILISLALLSTLQACLTEGTPRGQRSFRTPGDDSEIRPETDQQSEEPSERNPRQKNDVRPNPNVRPDPQPAALPASASSGCGKALDLAFVGNRSLQVNGDERPYILSVNNQYNPNRAHAVIFGWHGLGLDGAQMQSFVKPIEQLAGDDAIFVYPNAAIAGNKRPWNRSPTGNDMLLFDQLVASVGIEYCIDTRRVFSIGFSDGAFFTNSLGQARPDAVRAIVPIAGGGGGGKPIAAMVIHGNRDDNVGFQSGVGSANQWSRSANCQTTLNTQAPDQCQRLSGCNSEFPVWFCPWNGGHDWPRYPGANQDIWSFIEQF